jgi:ATP-binding cassette subfamily B protein
MSVRRGYVRRAIIAVVGARLDTKLNLHLFSRLLRLPLDYFERHPAGETMYQVAQVYRVREFLTGQLLATFLDLLTLAVLLPFLFWLNAPLAWGRPAVRRAHIGHHPRLPEADAGDV